MSPEPSTKHRSLAFEDRTLHPGWQLLEFLASIGADEFALRFLYAGDNKDACDQLMRRLAPVALGKQTRERTVGYSYPPTAVEVWRFDESGRQLLREIMPAGILGMTWSADAWAEDLCVYRRGELLFGTVTHEQYAFLRVTDAEWRQWEAQSVAAREEI